MHLAREFFAEWSRDNMKMGGSGLLAAVGSAGLVLFMNAPSRAQDASWGCQVLLCAASENPSWHGVPYCVPPMTKLIAAMVLPGFSWPICRQGNAGKPGKEIYEPCPAGWTPTVKNSAGGNSPRTSVADQCKRTLGSCNGRTARAQAQIGGDEIVGERVYSDSGHDRSRCELVQTRPREVRDKPYYFDIPNSAGVKQRFWFDLNK
jgi:hypothetical protein